MDYGQGGGANTHKTLAMIMREEKLIIRVYEENLKNATMVIVQYIHDVIRV